MGLNFRDYLFRVWYRYVNHADKNAEILFMNYGYSNTNGDGALPAGDENNRYSIQLYKKLADQTEISGKSILEVGCGRGGGLSFVVKNYKPSDALGVDLDPTAAEFNSKNYNIAGLSFKQGDAQKLDVESASKDVIFNVESSHRYPNMNAFVGEITRILRPGGYFLFTDFRYDYEMDDLDKDLNSTNLKLISKELITQNVVKALTQDDKRKRDLVAKLVPFFLRKTALNFAGTIGSDTFNTFDSRKYEYIVYVFRKEN
jgi:ubiquinone/menaquinone biosynthesis C-methylase UbiE